MEVADLLTSLSGQLQYSACTNDMSCEHTDQKFLPQQQVSIYAYGHGLSSASLASIVCRSGIAGGQSQIESWRGVSQMLRGPYSYVRATSDKLLQGYRRRQLPRPSPKWFRYHKKHISMQRESPPSISQVPGELGRWRSFVLRRMMLARWKL